MKILLLYPIKLHHLSYQMDCFHSRSPRHKNDSLNSLNNKNDLVPRQLKELFNWADYSLIEDIRAAAGGDFDKASSFLKAMVYDQSSREHENVEMKNSGFDMMEPVTNGKLMPEKRYANLKDISECAKTCSVLKPWVGNNIENVTNEIALSPEKLFDDHMEFNTMLGQLTSVPVEPEWEEDDVYLSSRKDAIKMMRFGFLIPANHVNNDQLIWAAAHHSKAATNSFLKGDHISAQQFSLKAREEWGAAQSLNAKAACDILSTRNENNGIWRLDLHGLHASEAVQAVKEHLHMIETQILSEGLRSSELPNRFRTKTEEWCASYPDGCNNLDKSDNRAFNKLKPIWLEIITGIGNHSRGGAALPTAVRTFLADNGYRFDEARPGAIMVRPKFRLS